MGTEIVKTRFQSICAASKETFGLVLNEQMKGITLIRLCEEPNKFLALSKIASDSNERQKLERVLKLMIVELNQSINVANNIRPSQIDILASHIISDFGYMTLEAVYLCFKGIILGDSGQIYRVDIPFICERLRKFDDEYYQLFAKFRDDKHVQTQIGTGEYKVTDSQLKEFYDKHKRG